MGGRVVRLCIVLGALAPIAACGLGDKEAHADAIVDSIERAFDAGTARGTLTISDRILELPGGINVGGVQLGEELAEQQQAAVGRQSRGIVADVVLDLGRDRAAVAIQGKKQPFAVFDGLENYGWRYTAGDRDARPWVRVDLEDLDEGGSELSPTEDAPLVGVFAISPVSLVDLVAGPLTGSIERTANERVGDVDTVRYDANFDIEKVLFDTRRKRWSEDRREAFEDLLDVLSVKGSTHEGSVWLDDEGRPRRFQLRLEAEPIRRFRFELIVDLQLTTFGDETQLPVPSPRERVEVRNVVQFLRSVVPKPGTPEFFTFLGVKLPTQPTLPTPPTTTTTVAPA